jgi:aromatic ring-opening dioxygenase catalytic subunit (LigB family)
MSVTASTDCASTPLRQPVLFIAHGGGPQFGPPPHGAEHQLFLSQLSTLLPEKPRAILVVSAHWLEAVATLQTGATPPLYYDYGGFPARTYQVGFHYPKGQPPPGFGDALQERIKAAFAAAGVPLHTDATRGFDHGVFVPLSQDRAFDDIPTAQLSLLSSLDPAAHLRLGEVLQSLRDEGVLIIGSGSSTHNRPARTPAGAFVGQEFNTWLDSAVREADYVKRKSNLEDWANAPGAHDAHPFPGGEEHLIPLHVAVGAAGKTESVDVWKHTPMNWVVLTFKFN